MRGKVYTLHEVSAPDGITPAYAGKSVFIFFIPPNF